MSAGNLRKSMMTAQPAPRVQNAKRWAQEVQLIPASVSPQLAWVGEEAVAARFTGHLRAPACRRRGRVYDRREMLSERPDAPRGY